MEDFKTAFLRGDQITLQTLPTRQRDLRRRHKAMGHGYRWDFDRDAGELVQFYAPTILRQASDMGLIHRVVGVKSRASENSLRDFIVVTLVGARLRQTDMDMKATFGWNVCLEIKTLAHPEGWFIRMPDGEYIFSTRVGEDGL